MMKYKLPRFRAILVIAISLLVFPALNAHVSYAEPQSAPRTAAYEIGWWTVDDGGGQELTGGGYTLKGTAGQPDAGTQSGTGYALSGGFWYVDVFGYHINLPLIRR